MAIVVCFSSWTIAAAGAFHQSAALAGTRRPACFFGFAEYFPKSFFFFLQDASRDAGRRPLVRPLLHALRRATCHSAAAQRKSPQAFSTVDFWSRFQKIHGGGDEKRREELGAVSRVAGSRILARLDLLALFPTSLAWVLGRHPRG